MKRHLLLLAIVAICACKKDNNTQPKTFDDGSFFKPMPSAGFMYDLVYDQASQAIYMGGSVGTSDGGAGFINLSDWQGNGKGRSDAMLMKYNLDGRLAWAKLIGGASGDVIKGVAIDNAQNVYVCGIFGGTVNFDGTELKALTSYINDQTLFIAKYTKDGKQLWVKKVTSAGIYNTTGLALDLTNNKLYVAGGFANRLTIGDAVYTKEGGGLFLVSYTLDGTLSWSKTYGDKEGYFYPGQLKLFKDGNVLVTATADGRQAIDGTEISVGSAKSFAAKFDANGTALWVKPIVGTSQSGLAIDESDNFYIASANYVGSYNNGMLAKYAQTGDAVWSTPLTSPGFSTIDDVYYRDKKLYTAGYYTTTGNFGTITIPAPDANTQGYTARYNSEDGKCESAAKFESTKSRPDKITVVNNFSYVFGEFESAFVLHGVTFKATDASPGFFMKFKTP